MQPYLALGVLAAHCWWPSPQTGAMTCTGTWHRLPGSKIEIYIDTGHNQFSPSLPVPISYLFQAHHPAPYGYGVWLSLKHVPVGRQKPLQGVPHLMHNHYVRSLLSILHIETYNNNVFTVFCAGWPAVLHISVCQHHENQILCSLLFPKLTNTPHPPFAP